MKDKAAIFNEAVARSYDGWLQTATGRYIDGREKSLILDLIAPRGGERLLDVGCGTGEHLLLFRRKGCDVTGIDPSPDMLKLAGEKLGNRADFHLGCAEDLPFSDNEFDIVTLITSLEFTSDPDRAISEAIRVCRGRVFLGVLNKYSCLGLHRRMHGADRPSVYDHARFFHIGELIAMIRNSLQGIRIRWGSVIFLPYGWYGFAQKMEEAIPVMKNPFGAFFGISFPVTFTYATIQEPIRETVQITAKNRQPVPGTVRGMK
ncbi:MAG: methyltransferase domain-containing protein [Deltaproteobacteria bacterium]|jgi:SAM-dependent methyltransferase|nr:methyltransferase domain-containing protein [Deltaproteobacteria bacterium]